MGSRMSLYRALLGFLVQTGYVFQTLSEFAESAESRGPDTAPVCLFRNDVDSDPAGAALMFACDQAAGVRATYFFRLSTLDLKLARQIANSGSEVGYHFEEIATVAKRLGLRSKEQVDANIEFIRREFCANFLDFAAKTGLRPRVVAAHGDFANRRIGIPNHYLLNREMLNELGIVADAYDPRIHASLQARFSDWPAPRWWNPADPVTALRERPATISILVHPRQWTCNPLLNIRLDTMRLREEVDWNWRRRMSSPRNAPLSPSVS
jgi:hypothetical protein